ncbi:hypothetical protein HDU76_012890 [Blyttiomyces sp. JEL0837]|nr:hypothetical protein HDU76_012890 [Blyttiomyces sp. JEL0837]
MTHFTAWFSIISELVPTHHNRDETKFVSTCLDSLGSPSASGAAAWLNNSGEDVENINKEIVDGSVKGGSYADGCFSGFGYLVVENVTIVLLRGGVGDKDKGLSVDVPLVVKCPRALNFVGSAPIPSTFFKSAQTTGRYHFQYDQLDVAHGIHQKRRFPDHGDLIFNISRLDLVQTPSLSQDSLKTLNSNPLVTVMRERRDAGGGTGEAGNENGNNCSGDATYVGNRVAVWSTAIFDVLIGTAYFSIPCELAVFMAKNPDFPYPSMIYLFALFIAACGGSHFVASWMPWYPTPWLLSSIKLVTAFVSCLTAFVLYFAIPKALSLPMHAKAMEMELNERAAVEQLLRDENEYMTIFREITHLVRHSLDRNVILQTGAREICDRFKARRCLLYLPVSNNPENNQLRCVAEVTRRGPVSTEFTLASGGDASGSGTGILNQDLDGRFVSTETIYETDTIVTGNGVGTDESDALLIGGLDGETIGISIGGSVGSTTSSSSSRCPNVDSKNIRSTGGGGGGSSSYFSSGGGDRRNSKATTTQSKGYTSDILDQGKSLAGVILDYGIPCVKNAVECSNTVSVSLDNCELGRRYGFSQRRRDGRGIGAGAGSSSRIGRHDEVNNNNSLTGLVSSEMYEEIKRRRKRQTVWIARIDLGGYGKSGLIVLVGPEDAYVDMSDLECCGDGENLSNRNVGCDEFVGVGVDEDRYDVEAGGFSRNYRNAGGGGNGIDAFDGRATLLNIGVHGHSQSNSNSNSSGSASKASSPPSTSLLSELYSDCLGRLTGDSQGYSNTIKRTLTMGMGMGTTERERRESIDSFINNNQSLNDTVVAERDVMARSVCRRSKLLLGDTAEQMGIALQQAVLNEQEKLRIVQLAEQNEALMQARKEVKVAQAHKDFTAVMSHEMRTPLFAISSLASLILELPVMQSSDDPDVQEAVNFMGVIKKSAQMLITIVNNILDFAKYEDNEFALDRNAFNLRTAFETATEIVAMQDQTDSYPVILTFISTNVPEVVVGDETRFRQIVINLVANACKFTGSEGDVEVHVSVGEIDVKDGVNASKLKLNVSVRDTGIGIKPHDADRLFQRFTQADTSITRKYGGTGLGLSIAKDLCAMMGGEINVRPNPHAPVGTEFMFSVMLDVYVPEEWKGVLLPPSIQSLRLGSIESEAVNVAIVEGNMKSSVELEMLLRTCGVMRYSRFSSLREALSASQSTFPKFSVLIIDYRTIINNDEIDTLHELTGSSEFGSRIMVLCSSQLTREYRRNRHGQDYATLLVRPPKLHLIARFLGLQGRGGVISTFPMHTTPSLIAVGVNDQHVETGSTFEQRKVVKVASLPKAEFSPDVAPGNSLVGGSGIVSSPLRTMHDLARKSSVTALSAASLSSQSSLDPPARKAFDDSSSDEFHALPIDHAGSSSASKTTITAGITAEVGLISPLSPTAFTMTQPQQCEDVLPKYNILVVEDNKINQLVIGKMLKKLGQNFEVADDGVCALEKLLGDGNTHPAFDIVFMDIMMPRKDGYQATQELRDRTNDPVRPWVIGLSANAFWDNKVRAMEVGMNDFICKPCSLDDLRGALNNFAKMQLAT